MGCRLGWKVQAQMRQKLARMGCRPEQSAGWDEMQAWGDAQARMRCELPHFVMQARGGELRQMLHPGESKVL